MPAPRLTIATASRLPFDDLIAVCEAMLAEYDAAEDEDDAQRLARINRTLDHMPAIYRFLLGMKARFDNLADDAGNNLGTRSHAFKLQRQRRDAFDDMARAARMAYEAASRRVTVDTSYEHGGMPTSRRTIGT